jgi:hypothetical protein
MTVQLTIVRSDPLDDADAETETDADRRVSDPAPGSPKTLPGVIAHHLDALRSREADDEVLELVTHELRRITGVRNVRSLQGRHSA